MKIKKGLIECEVRPVIGMSLYFLALVLWGLISVGIEMKQEYKNYLSYLYEPALNRITTTDKLFLWLEFGLIAFGIGILLLVFVQFKNQTSVQVGRFIKSLPYTNRQWVITKVSVGIMSFTIPYTVLVLGLIGIRSKHLYWIQDKMRINECGAFFEVTNSFQNLMMTLGFIYLIILTVYLLGVFLQYIFNVPVVGIVMTAIGICVPYYIILTVAAILDFLFEKFYIAYSFGGHITYELQIFNPLQYRHEIEKVGMLFQRGSDSYMYIILQIGEKMILLALVSALLLIGISLAGTKVKIEDAHKLIPFKWARQVMQWGVSICTGLLGGLFIVLRVREGDPILCIIAIGVGGIVGWIAGKLLANKGCNKEVKG